MNRITQDMKYRQSLICYAEKFGVSQANRKYNRSRSYIYFWKAWYDGTIEPLARYSRRPHSHPHQHKTEEPKLIRE
jgi:murein L,D-transpeptidase YafK